MTRYAVTPPKESYIYYAAFVMYEGGFTPSGPSVFEPFILSSTDMRDAAIISDAREWGWGVEEVTGEEEPLIWEEDKRLQEARGREIFKIWETEHGRRIKEKYKAIELEEAKAREEVRKEEKRKEREERGKKGEGWKGKAIEYLGKLRRE